MGAAAPVFSSDSGDFTEVTTDLLPGPEFRKQSRDNAVFALLLGYNLSSHGSDFWSKDA